MSCYCNNQYLPCDPQCPNCSGTTTTSTTTTTTLCPDAQPCVEVKKDICVEHPGNACFTIPAGTDVNALVLRLLSLLPVPPACLSTTTTTVKPTTTTTTTLVPTTTTTTCICPSTTTTSTTSTTTTTTLAPCTCITMSIKNITTSTQTYSYEDCSHIQYNDVNLEAGVTALICVCDQNLQYNGTKFIVLAIGSGCGIPTTSTTTSPTSTTTSTSSTTTTTTIDPCPACESYSIQALSLPASWSGKRCDNGQIVGGTFTTVGQSISTPCLCSTSVVLNNCYIKEAVNCIGTTTTSTSTTTTTTLEPTTTSTTSTTTLEPTTTTTTTITCECYTLSNTSDDTTAYAEVVDCIYGTTIVELDPLSTSTVCVVTGSSITADPSIVVTACGTSCTSNINCAACTTTTTTVEPTTSTTTTEEITTSTTTTEEPTTTTTTAEVTTTTTEEATTTTSTTTEEPTTTTTTTVITCTAWNNLSGVSAYYDWVDCDGTPHLNEEILNEGTICAQDGSVSFISGGTLTSAGVCGV